MIYLFDIREQLTAIIEEDNLLEVTHNIKINAFDEATIEFSYYDNLEEIKNAYYFGFFSSEKSKYDDSNEFKIFKIKDRELEGAPVLFGIDRAESDLDNETIIQDKRPQEVTADQALYTALENTSYQVGRVENLPYLNSTNFYYESPLEALVKIIEKWDCEFRVRYKFVENRVQARYIDLFKRQGTNSGQQFIYGDNLLRIKSQEDSDNVVTALIGRGRGEENENGNFGRRIEFDSVVWSKAKGDPVDKPKGQIYLLDDEARQSQGLFLNGEMKHRWAVFIDENEEDPEKLIKSTWEHLQAINHPITIFEADILTIGEHVGLGDRVAVIRDDIRLAFEARIFEISIDKLNYDNSVVTLGDYQTLKVKQQARAKQEQQKLNEQIENNLTEFGKTIQEELLKNDEYMKAHDEWIQEQLRLSQLDFEQMQERQQEENKRLYNELSQARERLNNLQNVAENNFNTLANADNEINRQLRTLDSAIKSAENTAVNAISNIELAKSDLLQQARNQTALSQRIETVSANANTIKTSVQELTKTVNNQTGEIETVKQQTKTVEDGINGLETRLSNMSVGYKNLVLNSEDFSSSQFQNPSQGTIELRRKDNRNTVYINRRRQSENAWIGYRWDINLDEIKQGEKYSILVPIFVESRPDNGVVIEIKNHRLNQNIGDTPTIPISKVGVWFNFSYTFEAKRDLEIPQPNKSLSMYITRNGAMYVGAPMLVRGEVKPLQHVKAEEDTIQELATYKQTTTQNLAELTQNIQAIDGKVTSSNSKIDQTAKSILSEVSALETQILTLEGTGRNFALGTATALKTEHNTSLKIYTLSEQAKTFTRDTNLWLSFDWSVTNPTSTSKFRINRVVNYRNGTASQWDNIIENNSDILTRSGRGSYSAAIPIWGAYNSTRISEIYLNLNQTVGSGQVTISNLKIEEGTTKTTYSQAPEDNLTQIQELKTSIEQTAGALETRMSVLETYKNEENKRATSYLSSARTETAKQIESERKRIEESYVGNNRYTEDVEGLRQTISRTQTSVNNVNNTVANYQRTVDNSISAINKTTSDIQGTLRNVDSRITQTDNKITQEINEVVKKIPNVVGQNILLGSGTGWSNTNSQLYNLATNLRAGVTYTVAARWWRNNNSTEDLTLTYRNKVTDPWSAFRLKYSGEHDAWVGSFTPTFEVPANTWNVLGFGVTTYNNNQPPSGSASYATLTQGNTPLTPWQAPPAEIRNSIETVSSAITQVSNRISLEVSSAINNQAVKKSDILVTSDGIVLSSSKATTAPSTILSNAIGSAFSVNPKAIEMFAPKIKVSGDMLVDGAVTTRKINSNAITADKIASGSIDTSKITTGGISANVIKTGVLTSQNDNTQFNLNNGRLAFNSNNTGVIRNSADGTIMGLRFNNHNRTVNGTSRTLSRIWLGGERREGSFTDKWGEGGFSGIVIDSIKNVYSADDDLSDRVSVVGDRIRFVHSYNDDPNTMAVCGWLMETFPPLSQGDLNEVVLRPYGANLNSWSASRVYTGDLTFCRPNNKKGSLIEIINALKGGLQDIVNGGTTDGAKSALRTRINFINQTLG